MPNVPKTYRPNKHTTTPVQLKNQGNRANSANACTMTRLIAYCQYTRVGAVDAGSDSGEALRRAVSGMAINGS